MKTIVMTGATSGLGEASARQLASQGHRLLLIVRDKSRGEATITALAKIKEGLKHSLYLADMASLSDLRRVAKQIRESETSVDILINNAGATFKEHLTTAEGIEKTIAVNHLAYFVLTLELKPLLKRGSRVVNTASFVHRLTHWDGDDLLLEKDKYSGLQAYYKSKLYNILSTRELARRWNDEGITVNSVNPGLIYTNFGKNELGFLEPVLKLGMRLFAGSAETGGGRLTYLATSEEVEGVTGKYFTNDKVEKETDDASSDEYAKVLWAKSLEWAKMV